MDICAPYSFESFNLDVMPDGQCCRCQQADDYKGRRHKYDESCREYIMQCIYADDGVRQEYAVGRPFDVFAVVHSLLGYAEAYTVFKQQII